jgi:hypothetical protein
MNASSFPRISRPIGLNTVLIVLLTFLIGCSSASAAGVARIEDAEPVPPKAATVQQVSQAPVQATSAAVAAYTITAAPTETTIPEAVTTKTDEDLTSEFAACLRDEGFNVSDPEVNADGSVDLRDFFTKLSQDPSFNWQDPKTREAIGKCRGLLADASFAQPRSTEDEIELQDQVLTFATCLREQGVPVADPDFSGGTRSGLRSMFAGQDIDRDDPKVAEAITTCRESSFTTRR